ncbi:MAG: dTDP-4-dehydrorhamnose reductase [Cyanothece sp. SIO1E1]|nr:dTDP-4-dehydrorhamnose reductase [Cyanothece sp. SIO1E1]
MKRILLTGISGQLGRELQPSLTALGEVIGFDRATLDLAQPDQMYQIVSEIKPDLIVNAAAYTAVDKAETESELANLINGKGPTVLAEAAQRLGAALIHISTDYVFDGCKNTPYTEEDTPNPINAYGRSKLLGEIGVRHACEHHIILRTAWVYGVYGQGNFVKTMLRVGAEREQLRVVVDQVGAPSWTGDIAQVIIQLGQKLISHQDISGGTYHFTNSGAISWYDFAVAIFEEAQQLGIPLKIQHVVPITTLEYPTPAARPAYSVLAHQKLSGVLGTYPPHWRLGLRKMLKKLYA